MKHAAILILGAFAFAPALLAQRTLVYEADFDDPDAEVGPEWSAGKIQTAPRNKQRFLGRFGRGTTTLSLTNLPPHARLIVEFDLIMALSWDGSGTWGPDIWECSLASGQRLIHTTFTGCGIYTDNNAQAYPEQYPGGPYPGYTGASAVGTLGYKWGGRRLAGGQTTDAVYPIRLAVPHAGTNEVIQFIARCDDPVSDQFFGFDNVRVSVADAPPPPSDEQLDAWWNALAGRNAPAVQEATRQLTWHGDATVAFLAEIFEAREEAARDLRLDPLDRDQILLAGRLAWPALRKALAGADRDQARQLRRLTREIAWHDIDSSKGRRLHRCRAVVRAMDSADAKVLLDRLDRLAALPLVPE